MGHKKYKLHPSIYYEWIDLWRTIIYLCPWYVTKERVMKEITNLNPSEPC